MLRTEGCCSSMQLTGVSPAAKHVLRSARLEEIIEQGLSRELESDHDDSSATLGQRTRWQQLTQPGKPTGSSAQPTCASQQHAHAHVHVRAPS